MTQRSSSFASDEARSEDHSSSTVTLRTSRARARTIGCILIAALLVGGVWSVDRVAMRLVYPKHQEFFHDVDHRPLGRDAEYNSDGIRDGREPGDFSPEDYNVIFLGDSFVHGGRLWPSESVPGVFEREARAIDPRVNAINFGWTSSSPFLSLRLLKRIGPRYHPDVIIQCIDMTDVHDDIKYRRYAERRGIFSLVNFVPGIFLMMKDFAHRMGVHEMVFGYPADRFFLVNQPLKKTRRQFRDIQASIDELYVTSVQMGAKFVVAVFPRHYQYSVDESPKDWERESYTRMGPWVREPFAYFDLLRRAASYPVRSVLDDFVSSGVFPTTFYNDPHWNAAGSRIAAKAILRILSEERLLPRAETSP